VRERGRTCLEERGSWGARDEERKSTSEEEERMGDKESKRDRGSKGERTRELETETDRGRESGEVKRWRVRQRGTVGGHTTEKEA